MKYYKGDSVFYTRKQSAASLISVMLWLSSHYITYVLNWEILVNLDENYKCKNWL